jgi:hypothetical protein
MGRTSVHQKTRPKQAPGASEKTLNWRSTARRPNNDPSFYYTLSIIVCR